MCFQFSTLNFYRPYGYHLKGRKWLVFFVFVLFSLLSHLLQQSIGLWSVMEVTLVRKIWWFCLTVWNGACDDGVWANFHGCFWIFSWRRKRERFDLFSASTEESGRRRRRRRHENTKLILSFFLVFVERRRAGFKRRRRKRADFVLVVDRRRERKKKKKSCRVFVWSKFVFIGRNSASFCCLWISREGDQHPGRTDESQRRFLFFWIVTMRVRTRTLVDRRGRASYDCVINSGTEMAEICRNFLR